MKPWNSLLILIVFALLGALPGQSLAQSSPDAVDAVIVVGGNISSNTTWTAGNVYYATSNVTVLSGVTLTLQPGVIVKFQSDRELIIEGKMAAIGSASQPVIFTSYRDDSAGGDTNGDGSSVGQRGDWNWIEFRSGSDDTSVLDRVEVRYGGSCCYDDRASIRLFDASPTIRNSVISYSGRHGIFVQNSAPTLVCNDIVNNQTLGLRNGTTSMEWISFRGARRHATAPSFG